MEEKKFAILIDADNISAKYIKYILDEISNYGVATYRRIYADWTSSTTTMWKNVLLENSITPMQQYSYTVGKNSTDSALIIDAMDILYSKKVEGFCIVSSDSDFTRLATRLRESGMIVIGMGEQKTPKPFISACNQFKFLDILAESEENEEPFVRYTEKISNISKTNDKALIEKNTLNKIDNKIKNMTSIKIIKKEIIDIINNIQDNDLGVNMGEVGNRLIKRYPDFDIRNYGYSKFSRFLADIDSLVVNKLSVILKSDIIEDTSNNKKLQIPKEIKTEIINIIEESNNKANIGYVNQKLLEKFPNYTVKKYGYNKAIKFFKALEFVSVKQLNNTNFLVLKN